MCLIFVGNWVISTQLRDPPCTYFNFYMCGGTWNIWFFFSLGIYALICFLISDSCTNLCLLVCVCARVFFSFSDGVLLASKSFHLHFLNVIYLLLDNLYLCNFSYNEKFMQMILFFLHFCLLVKWFIWIGFLRIGLSG